MGLESMLEGFKGKRILVVGDLMLDKFIQGDVSRISPEAPVPVIHVASEKNLPGGAANTANNLRALEAEVSVTGVVGGDKVGKELLRELKDRRIDYEGVLEDKVRPTTLKTRVISQNQQLLRIDNGSQLELDGQITGRLVSFIQKKLPEIDGVVISDYGKGVITHEVLEAVSQITKGRHIPVVVDPSPRNYLAYRDVAVFISNQKDACEALGMSFLNETSMRNMGHKMVSTIGCEAVVITRGKEGMMVFDKDGRLTNIPTRPRDVSDITGVSDTIASVYVMALCAGANYVEAAKIANYAGYVKVGKFGTATVNVKEIAAAMQEGDGKQG